MKYKVTGQIIVEDTKYAALGDDFSFSELEAIDFIISKVRSVLSGDQEEDRIYGNMCYEIVLSKNNSSIYCYDELIGVEPTIDVYGMLTEYRDYLKNKS